MKAVIRTDLTNQIEPTLMLDTAVQHIDTAKRSGHYQLGKKSVSSDPCF